jgi:hypothetical protein
LIRRSFHNHERPDRAAISEWIAPTATTLVDANFFPKLTEWFHTGYHWILWDTQNWETQIEDDQISEKLPSASFLNVRDNQKCTSVARSICVNPL